MNKLSLTSSLSSLILINSLTGDARAALIIYNDRTSWEAAVTGSTIITEDFNSYSTDILARGATFRTFSITSAVILVDAPPFDNNPGSVDIDGTTRLNLRAITTAFITLTPGVTAVAFETANYDSDNDTLQVSANGGSVIAAFPDLRGQVGFIGIVETNGTINSLGFISDGGTAFNALDNFSTAVPEPNRTLLASLGFGLIYLRRKR